MTEPTLPTIYCNRGILSLGETVSFMSDRSGGVWEFPNATIGVDIEILSEDSRSLEIKCLTEKDPFIVGLTTNDGSYDQYELGVKVYKDPKLGNPQAYNEVAVFPYPIDQLWVPINGVMTATLFNTILSKIEANYNFLIDKSDIISVPPNDITFRYGRVNDFYAVDATVWMQYANNYTQYWDYPSYEYIDPIGGGWSIVSGTSGMYGLSGDISGDDVFDIILGDEIIVDPPYQPSIYEATGTSGVSADCVGFTTPFIHVANTTSTMAYTMGDNKVLHGMHTNVTNPIINTRDYYTYGNDTFNNIKALAVDSNGYTWVLDSQEDSRGRIGVFTYNVNWRFILDWNSYDPTDTKYMLNPTDLKIKDGLVLISCELASGVNCVKVFTEGGEYQGVIANDDIGTIDSVSITANTIVVLSANTLYIFDYEYSFINKVDLTEIGMKYHAFDNSYSPSVFHRLIDNRRGAFFYALTENMIYKFGYYGALIESFGEAVLRDANNALTDETAKTVVDGYHDEYYNLYITSNYDVVKYVDKSEVHGRLLSDGKYDISDNMWSISNIDVDRNENTASWVYNRIFNRIYDSLVTFRASLIGSPNLTALGSFEIVYIDPFRPRDYKALPHDKHDIMIGINELHCEAALNRCIRQLQECFDTCLGLLNIRTSSFDPNTLNITSFTLDDPTAVYYDGVYYYDNNRVVSGFKFDWEDGFEFRSDPLLGGHIGLVGSVISGDHEYILPRSPTPTSFTCGVIATNTTHTWTLTETYGNTVATEGFVSDSDTIDIVWGRRILIGTIPDIDLSTSNSLTAMDQQYGLFKPEADITYTVALGNDRFIVAVPSDEFNAGRVELYAPNTPDLNGETQLKYKFKANDTLFTSMYDNGYENIEYTILVGLTDVMWDQIRIRIIRSENPL